MPARQSSKPGAARKLLGKLRKTPFHPQWFAFLREDRFLRDTCTRLDGIVLDIGCADGKPRRHLPAGASYIGLDYFETATEWYSTRPDVFADAQALPLADDSVDHVLLLDVLEHLRDPHQCLAEIHRVLKANGSATIQVPFLYPIHDAPRDFHRWTEHGLQQAAASHCFVVDSQQAVGHPLETAALSANIATSKTVLNWISGRNPLALTALLLPFTILVVNCMAWVGAALSRSDAMMPYAYRTKWVKD